MISAPYFDRELDGWILTRYADVTAALRDPLLWPVAARDEDQSHTRDELGRLKLRAAVSDTLAPARLAALQAQLEQPTRDAIAAMPVDRPVDLLSEFAQPWCLGVAMLITSAPSADRERLRELSNTIFAGTGAPEGSERRAKAAGGTAELDRYFAALHIPMGEPTFIATSQTTARLLTNSWLALIQNPGEYARLRCDPGLVSNAVEELIRYAGIVRRIYRSAIADLDLNGTLIRKGERVLLMLADANRDPEQFPHPDRLDLTRRFVSHVSLGYGRNSCVGAQLIRVALALATRALVEIYELPELARSIELQEGSGFSFPSALTVRMCRNPLF